MSESKLKGIPRHSRIVNPMAKEILSIVVTDDMAVQFKSPLPPRDVIKLLQNIITDVTFGVIDTIWAKASGEIVQTGLSQPVSEQHEDSSDQKS